MVYGPAVRDVDDLSVFILNIRFCIACPGFYYKGILLPYPNVRKSGKRQPDLIRDPDMDLACAWIVQRPQT